MATSGFEDFCGGTFWNSTLLLDSGWPQFTDCFVHTALVWLACGFLFLALPIYVTSVRDPLKRSFTFPVTLLNGLKLFCCITLASLSLVQLLLRATGKVENTSVAAYLSDSLWLAAFILMAVMTQYERIHGAQSQAVPFFFWLLTVLCNSVPLFKYIVQQMYDKNMVSFGVFTLIFSLQVVSLVLTGFTDHGWNKEYTNLEQQSPCPETTCSYPSYLLFRWITKLLVAGYKREVEDSDLWQLPRKERNDILTNRFQSLWQEQHQKCQQINKKRRDKIEAKVTASAYFMNGQSTTVQTYFNEKSRLVANMRKKYESTEIKEAKPNLLWVIVKMNFGAFFVCFLQKVTSDVFFLSTPLVLGVLLSYMDELSHNQQEYDWKSYMLCVALFVALLIKSISLSHAMFDSTRIGIRIKSSLTAAIYEKALKMSNMSRARWTMGEVVNMVAVDCNRILEMMGLFFYSITTPIQVAIAIGLLYVSLGNAIIAGLMVFVLAVPINTCLIYKNNALQRENLKFKDARTKLYGEILSGIKVLKLYAWEPSFREKIREIRLKEVGVLRKLAFTNVSLSMCWDMVPYLMTLVTFATYLLSDPTRYLDVSLVFVTLALFNVIKGPLSMLPTNIMLMIQAHVSFSRINDFLNVDDLDPDAVSHDCPGDNVISIQNGTFSWDSSARPTLTGINLDVRKGLLVAVVGPVGCGKSSLISSILGEMDKIEGRVATEGTIAYVPQQAWIQNASVQNNILFGSPMKRNKYTSVLANCELERDLEILAAGDLTEIGEKGINLSGGQKQRVSMARAVYSDSDVYLLDDPLSAVDSHVGKAIFNNVIGPRGVLKKKTRLLVTHGVHWLPMVDEVIVMADGKISDRGSYEELMSHDGPFAQFLKVHLTEVHDSDSEDMDPGVVKIRQEMARRVDSVTSDTLSSADEHATCRNVRTRKREKRDRRRLKKPQEETSPSVLTFDPLKEVEPSSGRLVTKETVEKGKVKKGVLKSYFKALGLVSLIFALLCFAGYQAFSLLGNLWLKIWSNDPGLYNASLNDLDRLERGNHYYLSIFGVMGIIQLVCLLAFNVLYWTRMVIGAKVIHAQLADRILRAPMSFFDTTPIGRILNRASLDVEVVDNTLPYIIREFAASAGLVMVTLIVVVMETPVTIIVIIPLCALYYFTQGFYVPAARQLKRLEAVSRSPIFASLSETITGAASIRSYGVSARFIGNMKTMLDTNLVYYFTSQAATRWLQLNVDFLVVVLVLASGIFALTSSSTESGDIGLSMAYALQVSSNVTWMTRQMCEFDTNIVSMERLKEYSELNTEADWDLPEKRPPLSWPEAGEVIFDNYQTRYREGLDLVLKGVTCTIKPGEKVGIVGRTGAGKSSLTLSLFRLIEAAGGAIYIDSVNVADIGLHDLRSRLTILPQDPVMFSGTLRMNLDPFGEYADTQLWQALDRAHLRAAVSNMAGKLAFECGEEGSNLSVGQRQLVCLARSLLRKTKILVLDEATAAVDLETDVLIQSTIRSAFADCTVITIAHRLNTILDYDKVMVMDSGRIVQFAPPDEMLSNPDSVFYALAKDSRLV